MKEFTNIKFDVTKFTPSPGYVLIDPLDKVEKSSNVAVVDAADKPHFGVIIKIGDTRLDEKGNVVSCSQKEGQYVWYSIAGIEETKMLFEDDPRHRFVIAPFSRILGGWNE